MLASDIVTQQDGSLRLIPLAGSSIDHVCKEAVELANERKVKVSFTFNRHELSANAGDSAEALARQYVQACEQAAERYRKSPEGIAAKAEQEARVLASQQHINRLVAELPSVVDSASQTMEWVYQIAEHGDLIGVHVPCGILATVLTTKWHRNALVGASADFINAKSSRIAEYTIGQVVDCLRRGMSPHPMVMNFVEEYRAAVAKEQVEI